ncbi:hypothetical protein Tsubulata_043173 [Turnera subulata]|uniref:Calcineurin B-like protein n=1 Tax=Turnera subulata TaxID=218843 RepID=A0A9Q0G2X7_9ROSI|nr:hypothetical protein Tsubulata_043173 [Turnera subulata]
MGCCFMKQKVKYDDPAVLAAQTCFTKDEVETLYELFKKLSNSLSNDDLLSKEELQLGLFRNSKTHSLFSDRIFELFDTKHDGVIEFGEFVQSLSVFHPKAPQDEKISFAFQLYDIWQTGFIEREEIRINSSFEHLVRCLMTEKVRELILALLRESDLTLTEELVEMIIDKTFKDADSKGDGKIDQEEWKDFATRNPSLLKNMTIPYLKEITSAFPSFVMRPDIEDQMH